MAATSKPATRAGGTTSPARAPRKPADRKPKAEPKAAEVEVAPVEPEVAPEDEFFIELDTEEPDRHYLFTDPKTNYQVFLTIVPGPATLAALADFFDAQGPAERAQRVRPFLRHVLDETGYQIVMRQGTNTFARIMDRVAFIVLGPPEDDGPGKDS